MYEERDNVIGPTDIPAVFDLFGQFQYSCEAGVVALSREVDAGRNPPIFH